MLFGIYFPQRIEFDRRFPWAKWIVIVPILLSNIAWSVALNLLVHGHADAAAGIAVYIKVGLLVVTPLYLAALILFFAAMAYKTVHASSPDARRRLLLLDAGVALSIPPVVIGILLQVTGAVQIAEWAILPILAALFVFPVTMAYVVVVERAMDVRVVLRQGLQYLLARGSLRALQIVLSVLIVAALATIGASTNPLNRILLVSVGLALVLLIGLSRRAPAALGRSAVLPGSVRRRAGADGPGPRRSYDGADRPAARNRRAPRVGHASRSACGDPAQLGWRAGTRVRTEPSGPGLAFASRRAPGRRMSNARCNARCSPSCCCDCRRTRSCWAS